MKEITSRQRAYLKSRAHSLDAIFQIGKSGITPEVTSSIDEALEARELIKINVLDNSELNPWEVSETLSGRARAIPVQVIGNKVILYRESKKNPRIELL